MSVDQATVKRVARLARIAVTEQEIPTLQNELNAILGFVEQLAAVNVEAVEPMTSSVAMALKMRDDVVTEGEMAEKIVANAALKDETYFVVPKVVE